MPRFGLFFLTFCAVFGASLDDAAGALAQKVASHLMPGEVAKISWHDPAPEAHVQSVFANALRRRARNPKEVEVHAALSHNLRGALLIAEIVRENGLEVEIVNAPEDAGSSPSPATLKLTMLWDQEAQILDLEFANDRMLVLDPVRLTSYQPQDGTWKQVDSAPSNLPPVRDARARIDLATSRPAANIFTPARNTLAEEGWPAHYAHAEIGNEHLLSETDGRVHVYDADHKAEALLDGWGTEFAAVNAGCAGRRILAANESGDSIALFNFVNHQAARSSEPTTLAGPVTEIIAQAAGAVVIAKNSKTGWYEAYSVAVDCGR